MTLHADIVFTGGAVFTGTQLAPPGTGVAVRAGHVAAVAPARDLEDLVGPRTERVDVQGGLLLPGFQDAHVHAVYGALEMSRCALNDLDTRDDYLPAIAAYVEAHPDLAWIKGGGWRMGAFPGRSPSAADLDAVTGGRPAFFWSKDAHMGWVNSRALELAGVTAATADVDGGRIGRMADGSPSGLLHEAAMDLVTRVMPGTTPRQMLAAARDAQTHLLSLGITAWQDPIVGRWPGSADPLAAYLELATSGELIANVVGALWWDRDRGLEQIDELRERRVRCSTGRLRASAVKIMQDGIMEACTASVLEPYVGSGAVHGHATSFVAPGQLRDAVVALDRAGFDVHFHTIGDRAVREALDAVHAALAANGRRDARHQLAHVQLVDPADLPRFAELGAIANVQCYWATRQELMVTHTMGLLGPERSARQYPFGDLSRAASPLAAGSDWPVSTADPLAAIHVAVNRTMVPGHRGAGAPPFFPEQALDLATILQAYTVGSARANRLDARGRIAVGAPADLVVLDRDLFAVPAGEIGTCRVLRTYVDGTLVHARP